MDQTVNQNKYTAIILAAGFGSRISNLTHLPKCLLEINGQTLLERNFSIWEKLGLTKVNIVLGHESELIKAVAQKYASKFEIHYLYNEDFKRLGNTHSLYLGIKDLNGPCLIFDADLIYDSIILQEFLNDDYNSEVLIGPGDLNDIECAKTLVDQEGFVKKTVDKRALTSEELKEYSFAGEAIGILKFTKEHTLALKNAAEKFLSKEKNQALNWEHLLNDFFPEYDVEAHLLTAGKWIEIDTSEDYEAAKKIFQS